MNVSNSINIKATPKKIWRLLSFDKAHLWIKEEVIFQLPSKEPIREGYVFTVTAKSLMQTLKYKGTVLAWKPLRKMSLLLQGGLFKNDDMTIHLGLTPKSQYTVMNYQVLMKEQKIASFVAPLTATVENYGANRFFDKIKEVAEKS